MFWGWRFFRTRCVSDEPFQCEEEILISQQPPVSVRTNLQKRYRDQSQVSLEISGDNALMFIVEHG